MGRREVGFDEARRLAALRRLGILDSEPEERFDRLAALAALTLNAPIALVSVVDADRQWFKARVGLEVQQTDRSVAFCDHAIRSTDSEIFVVPDALADERFRHNPLVVGAPMIRFYAGRVLRDYEGAPLGTMCVIDRAPRVLTEREQLILGHLGALVEAEFDRYDVTEIVRSLDASERTKALILNSMAEGLVLQDQNGRIVEWNPAAERLLGISADGLPGRASTDPIWQAIRADGRPWPDEDHPAMVALRTGVEVGGQMMGVHRPDGATVWLRVNSRPIPGASADGRAVLTVFADATQEIESEQTRNRLEAQLRHREEAARTSLDALEEGVVLADRKGAIVRINPAAERLLGYKAAELTVLWGSDSWHSFDDNGAELASDQRPLWRALHLGETIRGERVWWTRRDGERILLRLSCVPVVDGPGEVVIAFSDITSEHAAHTLLDAALEAAPVGLAALDEHGVIVRTNPSFAAQAGISGAELVGMSASDICRPIETSALGGREPSYASVLGTGERRILRPDGSDVWVSVHHANIRQGGRARTVIASVDVTAQRRMLHVLSRFALMFRYANDIITVVDRAGQIQYVSPSNARMLGYPEGFAHPGGILAIVHPEDRHAVEQQLRAMDRPGARSEPVTVRVATATGEWRHMEQVAVSLLHEAAVNGIVLTARDVTDRERLSRELVHRAAHDPLTGLLNRSMLGDLLESALSHAERTGQFVGVCFIDLDGFKSVNDTHGHDAGDELLRQVAHALRTTIRTGDAALRLGGDEFVVVLDTVESPDAAVGIASRLRDALLVDVTPSLVTQGYGASIGVALQRPSDSATTLLKRADNALYRAKAKGGSAIEMMV